MPIKNSASMQYVPTPMAGRDVMAKKQTSLIDRIAANWQSQGGLDGLLNALSQDATRIGGKIEKDVNDLGATMRLPHGTKPEAYDAVTGAAINTMGLGYGPAVGRMAMGARPDPSQLNIGVWQGGPNKYGPEGAAKSLDHMGKGEGAQAYGWGRYDAESDSVASQYRANVRNIDDSAFKKVGFTDSEIKTARQTAARYLPEESDMAAKDFSHWLGKELKPETNLAFKEAMGEGSYLYKHDLPDADVERYLDWDKPLSEQPNQIREGLESMKAAKTSAQKEFDELEKIYVQTVVKGSDAEINAINARRGELRKIINQSPDVDMNMTGAELYKKMESERVQTGPDYSPPRGPQAASEALGKAGIPGLKYYDGMSRTTTKPWRSTWEENGKWFGAGDGVNNKPFKSKADADVWKDADPDAGKTRNFVTWDQDVLNRMKLLERNGEEF